MSAEFSDLLVYSTYDPVTVKAIFSDMVTSAFAIFTPASSSHDAERIDALIFSVRQDNFNYLKRLYARYKEWQPKGISNQTERIEQKLGYKQLNSRLLGSDQID